MPDFNGFSLLAIDNVQVDQAKCRQSDHCIYLMERWIFLLST